MMETVNVIAMDKIFHIWGSMDDVEENKEERKKTEKARGGWIDKLTQ